MLVEAVRVLVEAESACGDRGIDNRGRESLTVHSKKSLAIFPSPAGIFPTKLSLAENNNIFYSVLIEDVKVITESMRVLVEAVREINRDHESACIVSKSAHRGRDRAYEGT